MAPDQVRQSDVAPPEPSFRSGSLPKKRWSVGRSQDDHGTHEALQRPGRGRAPTSTDVDQIGATLRPCQPLRPRLRRPRDRQCTTSVVQLYRLRHRPKPDSRPVQPQATSRPKNLASCDTSRPSCLALAPIDCWWRDEGAPSGSAFRRKHSILNPLRMPLRYFGSADTLRCSDLISRSPEVAAWPFFTPDRSPI